LNIHGEASTDEFKLLPPAAEVELDQNKTSSQKKLYRSRKIRVGQMFAKDNIDSRVKDVKEIQVEQSMPFYQLLQ
jgi:hypothetical protein